VRIWDGPGSNLNKMEFGRGTECVEFCELQEVMWVREDI
jgi:hypothetical protein